MRFETLIERHHDELYYYLWRVLVVGYTCSPQDVEDAVQEVFAKAYHAYPRLTAGSNHRAWLYRIATNYAITFGKKQVNMVQSEQGIENLDWPDRSQTTERYVEQGESHRALQAAISDLPPMQRSALVLRYLDEYSYREIADILACSKASARANVYQALTKLRQYFKHNGEFL